MKFNISISKSVLAESIITQLNEEEIIELFKEIEGQIGDWDFTKAVTITFLKEMACKYVESDREYDYIDNAIIVLEGNK